ncbi:AMP-dependent synthetase [Rhodobacteraceae bacterium CCMM004]|nr:AMP-dependent synthetase [Rhodobacteraceae bacterium CCMM004]
MPNEPGARRLLTPGTWPDGFDWDIPERFNIAERCCDSWAAADPDRLALIHVGSRGDARWSYGDLSAASDRAAGALAAAGVRRGDRVAVLLPQGPATLIAHFATYKLGAIAVPLFTLFGPEALAFRLRDSGAKVAVTDPENLEKLTALRDGLPDLVAVFCTGGGGDGAHDFDRAARTHAPLAARADTRAEDPAVLIYTSGTTGPPKGALHAHRFLLGHLTCMEVHHEGYPAPGDVGWTPADWAWIGGLMDMAMPCLYYGVPLVSHRMRKFDAAAAWELIARLGINRLFVPPTALKLMRQAPVPAGVAVRSIGSGGESLGPDLLAWGRDALGAPINEIYGQTECNLVVASARGQGVARQGAMGRAVPGHILAVLDAEGREVPAGEEGEICVRAPDPVMFLGYWNRPDATTEKLRDGWLRTGDLGRRDADGYVWYVARDDDVITSSGYRIGPTEIENCLKGHDDVVQAAVVGLPDPDRTEVVTAFVTLRDGADWEGLEADLIARVRSQVSPHLAPRRVHRVDALPTTATGKIRRRALRESPPV